MSERKIIGEVSETQINKWKNQTAEVHGITVDDEEGNTHICYVKKPDLDIIGQSAKHAESDPMLSLLIMFNSTWLGGSDKIQSDDEMKLGAMKQIKTIFKVREAQIKKL